MAEAHSGFSIRYSSVSVRNSRLRPVTASDASVRPGNVFVASFLNIGPGATTVTAPTDFKK